MFLCFIRLYQIFPIFPIFSHIFPHEECHMGLGFPTTAGDLKGCHALFGHQQGSKTCQGLPRVCWSPWTWSFLGVWCMDPWPYPSSKNEVEYTNIQIYHHHHHHDVTVGVDLSNLESRKWWKITNWSRRETTINFSSFNEANLHSSGNVGKLVSISLNDQFYERPQTRPDTNDPKV